MQIDTYFILAMSMTMMIPRRIKAHIDTNLPTLNPEKLHALVEVGEKGAK
jgi:hypothetical protein